MFKAKRATVCLSCLSLLLLAASCGRDATEPRDRSFLTVEQPRKISDLVLPGLVRDSRGSLLATFFIHSAFPSATEARDALAVLTSEDEGATWQEISRIPSHITYGVWGRDLAIDAGDRLYVTWVAGLYKEDSPQPFKAVMFSRSNDGGRSWGEPIRVSSATAGQRRHPVIAVWGKDVYITWLDDGQRGRSPASQALPGDVYLASSNDRGATWSSDVCLETDLDKKTGSSGEPSLCITADGTVYCAWFSIRRYKKKVGGCWIAKSTDGAKTFSTSLCAVGPLGDVLLTEAGGSLYLTAVYISAIKRLSMREPQTAQEIRLYVSADGGAKWSKPVTIDDDEQDRHKSNLRLVSLGPDRLLACWHDERRGVYAAASVDGGKTWGKNVKVADPSHAGATPLDLAADPSTGVFHLLVSDVRKGSGDATYLVKGGITETTQGEERR